MHVSKIIIPNLSEGLEYSSIKTSSFVLYVPLSYRTLLPYYPIFATHLSTQFHNFIFNFDENVRL